MIEFKDNGEIVIDGFDGKAKTTTIRPPKYGALKRLRRERENVSDRIGDKLMALTPLEAIPAANDEETDDEKAERRALVLAHRDRAMAINDLNNEAMVELWTFIFFGHGDDFAGLADPKPSDDPDDWPASIIFDAPEFGMAGLDVVRLNPALMEQVFQHWGKARSRSGPTPAPM